jgi:hypothetical protein
VCIREHELLERASKQQSYQTNVSRFTVIMHEQLLFWRQNFTLSFVSEFRLSTTIVARRLLRSQKRPLATGITASACKNVTRRMTATITVTVKLLPEVLWLTPALTSVVCLKLFFALPTCGQKPGAIPAANHVTPHAAIVATSVVSNLGFGCTCKHEIEAVT